MRLADMAHSAPMAPANATTTMPPIWSARMPPTRIAVPAAAALPVLTKPMSRPRSELGYMAPHIRCWSGLENASEIQ